MSLERCFRELTDAERATLTERAKTLQFSLGEHIIDQEQTVETLLVVKTGNLRVTQHYLDDLLAEFIGPLGPGDVIGEMSFVDGAPASATLIADGDVELLSISRDDIEFMTGQDPEFLGRFYKSLFLDIARRLRATNKRVMPPPT